MKKTIVCILSALLVSGCATTAETSTPTSESTTVALASSGNYTDEMVIPPTVDLDPEYGADSVYRNGDHVDSPYFNTVDFYSAKSTDSLTILEQYKTYQQTSEWSCGVAAVLTILEYYGKLGDYNEQTLAEFRTNGLNEEATTLESVIQIFEGVGGFEVASTYDYDDDTKYEEINLEMIQKYLQEGTPVAVCWNDWGGHWQVIIGYDTMGTETTQDDVIIVADPYDTTDHNQDGYGVYGAERFYYNWTMYDFFESMGVEERDLLFAAAVPVQE